MKILIWIKKEDGISGNISEHHAILPQGGYSNYIQVSISVNEFVRLEDTDKTVAMIYERNPDTNEIRSREVGKK